MGWLENIGKSLPIEKIYADLASKPTQEVGDIILNSVKAARCILAPIDYLAAQQDKFQNYLKRVNNKVPEGNQINAHPSLTGPIIENLKYLEEDSLITEMFLNLLARAIDKERVSEAHPAFSKIISQLSPDEAVIIYYFSKHHYKDELTFIYEKSFKFIETVDVIKTQFPTDQLKFPNNYRMYLDHLNHLNLLAAYNDFSKVVEGSPYNHKYCLQTTRLTSFGTLFSKATIPEDLDLL